MGKTALTVRFHGWNLQCFGTKLENKLVHRVVILRKEELSLGL